MTNYKGVSRNDINKVATQIEGLAKELQLRLNTKGDVFTAGSELFRNASTLVFALGELYHAENAGSVAVTSVTPNTTAPKRLNYHNKRDAHGRFAAK